MFSFTMNLTQRLTATEAKRKKINNNFWWNKFMSEPIPEELKPEWLIYLINVGMA